MYIYIFIYVYIYIYNIHIYDTKHCTTVCLAQLFAAHCITKNNKINKGRKQRKTSYSKKTTTPYISTLVSQSFKIVKTAKPFGR